MKTIVGAGAVAFLLSSLVKSNEFGTRQHSRLTADQEYDEQTAVDNASSLFAPAPKSHKSKVGKYQKGSKGSKGAGQNTRGPDKPAGGGRSRGPDKCLDKWSEIAQQKKYSYQSPCEGLTLVEIECSDMMTACAYSTRSTESAHGVCVPFDPRDELWYHGGTDCSLGLRGSALISLGDRMALGGLLDSNTACNPALAFGIVFSLDDDDTGLNIYYSKGPGLPIYNEDDPRIGMPYDDSRHLLVANHKCGGDGRSGASALDLPTFSPTTPTLLPTPSDDGWDDDDDGVVAELKGIDYTGDDGTPLKGFLSEPTRHSKESRCAVVILPDRNNVSDHEKKRAGMISKELGFFAFAADVYGADKHDVQDGRDQEIKYRYDPNLLITRIQSSINVVKNQSGVDPSCIAIIGYGLGGLGVIDFSLANTGRSDIVGAVSFHGTFKFFDAQGNMSNPLLVLSGALENSGYEMEILETTLNEANADWQITRYSHARDGFAVFGHQSYNAWVDGQSWKEMSYFLNEVFKITTYDQELYGEIMGKPGPPNVTSAVINAAELPLPNFRPGLQGNESFAQFLSSTSGLRHPWAEFLLNTNDYRQPPEWKVTVNDDNVLVDVETVNYSVDLDMFGSGETVTVQLRGYVAIPRMLGPSETLPAVVILPTAEGVMGHWIYNGVDKLWIDNYHIKRAILAAKNGYVAMVADIYGAQRSLFSYPNYATYDGWYKFFKDDRPDLFVQNIQAGIDEMLNHKRVDENNIFVAGYCFGGTGVVDYVYSENALKKVKAVVAFHGNFQNLAQVHTAAVQPYVMIQAGGADEEHGDNTLLEEHLTSSSANWEISRYSNVRHGHTIWTNTRKNYQGAYYGYDASADSRSWSAMMSLFDTIVKADSATPWKSTD